MINVAEHVVSKIGGGGPKGLRRGVLLICSYFGMHPPAVYRWVSSRRIPTFWQDQLIPFARAEVGVDLGADDFFDPALFVPVNDNAAPVAVGCHEDGPAVQSSPVVQA